MDNDANKNTEGKIRPTDNSGKTVQGIDQVLKYDYNEKGERTSLERDNNVDGKFDYREEYTLNANGNILETGVDLLNDGKIEKITKNTLNAQGNIVSSEYYNQTADGTQIYTGKGVYKLDNNGNYTEKSTYSAIDALHQIETYELDAKGNIVKKFIDNYGDGTIERAEIYSLDAYGRIAKIENDVGNDGIIDSQSVSTYNALGRRTKLSADNDNNGVFDRISEYKYDVYGNNYHTINFNTLGDKISETIVYSYDSHGRRLEHYIDRLGDGPSRDDTFYKSSYNDVTGLSRVDYYRGDSKEWYGADIQVGKDNYGRVNVIASPVAENSQEIASYYNIAHENPIYINAETQMKNFLGGTMQSDGSISGGQLNWTADFIISETGGTLKTFIDNVGEKDGSQYEQLIYGNRQNNGALDFIDDFTTWSTEDVNRLKGLRVITLSKSDASTEITLDSAIIGKMAPTNSVGTVQDALIINGDATDKVNLKGDSFTKLATTFTGRDEEFDMYSTEVDGKTYTLYIDNDIQTVIA
ncbi:hypothetical protein ACERCG_09605 [Mannheimia sp. E30BD]|uniref:hypothetical protein n=1 Tax=Mannheimia sp. E30BD TaxID=3278708 RepID=UPI00359EEFE7